MKKSTKKKDYLEDIMSREFYDFYRKNRRKPSKTIDQYNYFEKAINGMVQELRSMLEDIDTGVHLKGLGVFYKKPFGEYLKKLTIFTHTKINRKIMHFYLEDDYLRGQYLPTNLPKVPNKTKEKIEDKATAILLHRKLKLKK